SAARNLNKKSALEYQNLSNNLNAELTWVLYKLDDSYKKAIRYQTDLIPMSLDYLHTTEKEYISGNSDFYALTDAQRRYLQLLLEYESIIVQHQKMKAQLYQLTGGSNGKVY
ncbi:MAG: TolC family protein, partial [Candidatus Marinimicrobia bacterium]|nr:TolC family protein [Candidatus Neomarinimicrobiota bacterium]